MPRGRKPTPAHLKLVRGNPGNRPVYDNEPKPQRVLPDPPEILSEDAATEWRRVSTELYNLGLLTTADVQTLAAYCQAYGRWVAAERAIRKLAERDLITSGLMIKTTNGNAIQNPLVGTANTAARDMVRYASEFGLTPAARARLSVGSAPPASKFEGLLG